MISNQPGFTFTPMNKTAEQLRLAASIIETGHPWGYRRVAGTKTKYESPLEVIVDGNFLIPLLATPPDNRPLHNPDNLTAEQVGAGWRLTVLEEHDEFYGGVTEYWSTGKWRTGWICKASVRVPLSIPWPEPAPPVDPYAELKAAHAAGRVIQSFNHKRDVWQDCPSPAFEGGTDYRIKPEPPFQLPPPPPGMQWHRTDGWTAEMLPQGYRPLTAGERLQKNSDSFKYLHDEVWEAVCGLDGMEPMDPTNCFYRTTRPLTFTHEGKTWTWHRLGDKMPCDGERKIEILCVDDSTAKGIAKIISWSGFCCPVGWRYADEPRFVALGPEDVPPGSVFKHHQWKESSFRYPKEVNEYGVHWTGDGTVNSQPHNTHKFSLSCARTAGSSTAPSPSPDAGTPPPGNLVTSQNHEHDHTQRY